MSKKREASVLTHVVTEIVHFAGKHFSLLLVSSQSALGWLEAFQLLFQHILFCSDVFFRLDAIQDVDKTYMSLIWKTQAASPNKHTHTHTHAHLDVHILGRPEVESNPEPLQRFV